MWYQNRMLKCGWQLKHRSPQAPPPQKKNPDINKCISNCNKDISVNNVTKLKTGWNKNCDLIPGRGRDPKVSRSALSPNQPHLQWVMGALPLEVKWTGVQLTSYLHLVPWLQMHEEEPPLPLCLCGLQRGNFTSILGSNKGKKADLSSSTCLCYTKFPVWFCTCNKTQSSNFTDKNLILRCRYTN